MVKHSTAPMQIRIHLIRHGLRRATFSSRRRLWLVRLINSPINWNLSIYKRKNSRWTWNVRRLFMFAVLRPGQLVALPTDLEEGEVAQGAVTAVTA